MVHKIRKLRRFREHTWSSRHCRRWSHCRLSNSGSVGAHLDSAGRSTTASTQAHRQALAGSGGVVVATVVIGIEEFLEPLQKLKVVLETALNQP